MSGRPGDISICFGSVACIRKDQGVLLSSEWSAKTVITGKLFIIRLGTPAGRSTSLSDCFEAPFRQEWRNGSKICCPGAHDSMKPAAKEAAHSISIDRLDHNCVRDRIATGALHNNDGREYQDNSKCLNQA